MRAMTRTSWFLPMFSVGLGIACLAGFWIGGQPGSGLWAIGVMLVLALLFAVGGWFDLIRGLRGDGRDEYWARIDLHATALSGIVVISAVIVMCLWEWAHGRDGSPYSLLGAIGGVAYVLAIAGLRLRS